MAEDRSHWSEGVWGNEKDSFLNGRRRWWASWENTMVPPGLKSSLQSGGAQSRGPHLVKRNKSSALSKGDKAEPAASLLIGLLEVCVVLKMHIPNGPLQESWSTTFPADVFKLSDLARKPLSCEAVVRWGSCPPARLLLTTSLRSRPGATVCPELWAWCKVGNVSEVAAREAGRGPAQVEDDKQDERQGCSRWFHLPVLLTVARSSTFPSVVMREWIRSSAPTVSC